MALQLPACPALHLVTCAHGGLAHRTPYPALLVSAAGVSHGERLPVCSTSTCAHHSLRTQPNHFLHQLTPAQGPELTRPAHSHPIVVYAIYRRSCWDHSKGEMPQMSEKLRITFCCFLVMPIFMAKQCGYHYSSASGMEIHPVIRAATDRSWRRQ